MGFARREMGIISGSGAVHVIFESHEKVNSFTSTTMQKNNIPVFHGQILKDQVLLNFLAFNVSIALP